MVKNKELLKVLITAVGVVVLLGCIGSWQLAKAAEGAGQPKAPVPPVAQGAEGGIAASGHNYVGMGKCKMCHKAYATAWDLTPHAKAFAALDAAKKENENPKCVKCHVTGFGAGGYELGKGESKSYENVQCEACHGAGSDYQAMTVMKDKAKAIAAGLIVPVPEAVCVKCHNKESPNFKAFDYKTAVEKGVHKVEKKPEAPPAQ